LKKSSTIKFTVKQLVPEISAEPLKKAFGFDFPEAVWFT